jgi:hypothetical protein
MKLSQPIPVVRLSAFLVRGQSETCRTGSFKSLNESLDAYAELSGKTILRSSVEVNRIGAISLGEKLRSQKQKVTGSTAPQGLPSSLTPARANFTLQFVRRPATGR